VPGDDMTSAVPGTTSGPFGRGTTTGPGPTTGPGTTTGPGPTTRSVRVHPMPRTRPTPAKSGQAGDDRTGTSSTNAPVYGASIIWPPPA
jgi:hypothetical protein